MFNKIKKRFIEEYELDMYFNNTKESKLVFIIKYIFENIHYKICNLICKIKGHKWEDEGSAGSESGYIEMCCNRCGYSNPREYLY
jgi:hypothetical protein